jgi:hypothetical protein
MRTVLSSSHTRFAQILAICATLLPVEAVYAGGFGEATQPVLAQTPQSSDQLEVHLLTYALPNDFRQQEGIETTLSSEVGVADTRLVGMRVIVSVPHHLRFERMEVQIADGLFLVHESSKWKSVGRFLMGVARWLLIGRLVSNGGDDLQVSATAWTLLLGNEQLVHDSVVLDPRDHATIDRDDSMATNHGDFMVCRMVMAKNPMSELINMTIWATELDDGQPVRFVIPRLKLPKEEQS